MGKLIENLHKKTKNLEEAKQFWTKKKFRGCVLPDHKTLFEPRNQESVIFVKR